MCHSVGSVSILSIVCMIVSSVMCYSVGSVCILSIACMIVLSYTVVLLEDVNSNVDIE